MPCLSFYLPLDYSSLSSNPYRGVDFPIFKFSLSNIFEFCKVLALLY